MRELILCSFLAACSSTNSTVLVDSDSGAVGEPGGSGGITVEAGPDRVTVGGSGGAGGSEGGNGGVTESDAGHDGTAPEASQDSGRDAFGNPDTGTNAPSVDPLCPTTTLVFVDGEASDDGSMTPALPGAGTCGGGTYSAVYEFDASATGSAYVRVDSFGFDAAWSVRTECASRDSEIQCDALSNGPGLNDGSFNSVAGETYYLWIAVASGDPGAFSVMVRMP